MSFSSAALDAFPVTCRSACFFRSLACRILSNTSIALYCRVALFGSKTNEESGTAFFWEDIAAPIVDNRWLMKRSTISLILMFRPSPTFRPLVHVSMVRICIKPWLISILVNTLSSRERNIAKRPWSYSLQVTRRSYWPSLWIAGMCGLTWARPLSRWNYLK